MSCRPDGRCRPEPVGGGRWAMVQPRHRWPPGAAAPHGRLAIDETEIRHNGRSTVQYKVISTDNHINEPPGT